MQPRIKFLAMGAATALTASLSLSPALAETVNIQTNPARLQFEVGPNGELFGSGEVEYNVSRSDPPQGIFQSCQKVYRINAFINGKSVAQESLKPPLCSFSGKKVRAEVFSSDEVIAACRNQPGKKLTLHKNTKLIMFNTYYSVPITQGYEKYQVTDRSIPLAADVTCLPSIDLSVSALQPDGKEICYEGTNKLVAILSHTERTQNSAMLPREIDLRLEVVDKSNRVKRYDITNPMPYPWPTTPVPVHFNDVEVPLDGPTTFRVTIDPEQKILETEEGNNQFTVTSNVQTKCPKSSTWPPDPNEPKLEPRRDSPAQIEPKRLPDWNRPQLPPPGLPKW